MEGDVIAAYQEGIITTAGRGVKELLPRAAHGRNARPRFRLSTLGLHLALRRLCLDLGGSDYKRTSPLVRAFAQARAVREMRLMILGDKTSERKPV